MSLYPKWPDRGQPGTPPNAQVSAVFLLRRHHKQHVPFRKKSEDHMPPHEIFSHKIWENAIGYWDGVDQTWFCDGSMLLPFKLHRKGYTFQRLANAEEVYRWSEWARTILKDAAIKESVGIRRLRELDSIINTALGQHA